MYLLMFCVIGPYMLINFTRVNFNIIKNVEPCVGPFIISQIEHNKCTLSFMTDIDKPWIVIECYLKNDLLHYDISQYIDMYFEINNIITNNKEMIISSLQNHSKNT